MSLPHKMTSHDENIQHNLCYQRIHYTNLSLWAFWESCLTVLPFHRKKNQKADSEQKARGLIRTATGIVAKLISQKEIGLQSISVSSREANLPGTPQGEQPWCRLPDSTAMIAEWVQVKFGGKWRFQFPPQPACQEAGFTRLQSFTISLRGQTSASIIRVKPYGRPACGRAVSGATRHFFTRLLHEIHIQYSYSVQKLLFSCIFWLSYRQ